MPLASGQTLTHYEILAPLGAGGMGEVYRARDTRLDREVAIKVLPEHFADDEERLARFEREAKTLASLNHPNIAGIHGIDQVEDTCFLAMELVPGEDLAERLARGPLPVDEALDVCRQIAEGLEAAHEAGVVHRDLKPANVRITPDGVVKLLDFGLAKPKAAPDAGGSSTRPDSFVVTSEGMILGTPTYMSPEQARGKPIDRRTDIWAFGCVLYECLTGKRAFDGEAFGELMAAILEREPDLDALPRATPPHARELVRRALVKDPRLRLRDVGEARLALSGALAPAADDATNRAPVPPAARAGWVLVSALLAAAFFAGYRFRPVGDAAPRALQVSGVQAVTYLEDLERRPSLSPDGRHVVYEARTAGTLDLWSQRVGGSRAQNLTAELEGEQRQPAFSPDGERIAFRSEHDGGGLFVMGASGESPRRVTDFGFSPCWSPDGARIAFSAQTTENPRSRGATSPLYLADVASGEVREIDVDDAADPAWSPDGRWIAYWGYRDGGQRDLYLVSPDGGDPVALTDDAPTDWGPTWSADGTELFFSSDRGGVMSIWRLAVDAETGRPRGAPRPVIGGVGAALEHPSPSRDGTRIAFTSSSNDLYLARVGFDPERRVIDGSPERIPGTRGAATGHISPDGEWIAFHSGGAQEDLFVIRPDGSGRRQVTDDPYKDRIPRWSPDGQRLFFHSDRAGPYEAWSCALDGSDLVQHSQGGGTGPKLSPDGRRLVLGHRDGRLGFLDVRLSGEPREPTWAAPYPEPGVDLDAHDWSPDGRRLTVKTSRGGESGLALLSSDGATYEPILEQVWGGGWLPDGSGVIFTDERGALGLWDAETGERRELLSFPQRSILSAIPSPDGAWLCLEIWAGSADVWVANLEPEE